MKDRFADKIDEVDASVLRRLSTGKQAVFEFGTFAGASAMAMLPQLKESGGHLWCIDHFHEDAFSHGALRITPAELMAYLVERIEPYRSNVTIIYGDITEANNYPEGFADMVFIDASHSYSLVKRDIEIALRLCRPGGTVCGHDYVQHYDDCDLEKLETYADLGDGFYAGVGYGVIKAVHEFFGTPNKEGAVWWTERPHTKDH